MNTFYLYRKAWRFDGAPHEEPRLQEAEWKALLKQGGLLVRNTFDFDCPEETPFWNLIKDRFGGLEELSGNTRKKVRRSLEKLEFEPIGIELIEREGFPILKATYKDYVVSDRVMDQRTFDEYLGFCKKKTYDYWGIFDKKDGRFIGFCTTWVWSDAVEYGLVGILPEYKRECTAYPYYGLFYSMNQYYLQEKGLSYVTDGTRSITEHSNIQPFLEEKFHFRKAYCHLEVHYNWWMKPLVKILYPFRKIIPIPSVQAVLNMESMQE